MSDGQTKTDNEKSKAISIRRVRYNAFGNNVSVEKVYRKGERIVAALYMLTRHVPDTEPIKCLIRECGHTLLKDIMVLRSGFRTSAGSPALVVIHVHIRELITHVQLLGIGGFISGENADLVTRALEELAQFIESSRGGELAEEVSLSKEDLLIESRPAYRHEGVVPVGGVGRRTSKNVEKSGGGVSGRAGQGSLSGRRAAIVEVLKSGRPMGIKDIASFVAGCSEKTVQRELAALISTGLVRKEGEKRWSRYQLVSTQ